MSLSTRSSFYYGFVIDNDNYLMDFDEGGSELTAELNFGDYSLSDLLVELKRALEAEGALTYTVTVNRSTRKITIAASGTFSLLVSSGSHASNVYDTIGFTGSDRTSAATYTADSASGSSYLPQFNLQKYVPPEHSKKKNNVTIQESASSDVEVVYFGNVQMMEADIQWATSIGQPSNGPITTNYTGVDDLNSFMTFAITKAPFEFMPDKDSPNTYYKVILESTPEEKNGTAYKLKENQRAPGYYDTGTLIFRVIE